MEANKEQPQTFTKTPSKVAEFFKTEDIWQELVDPSEADSTPEEVEDHEEWEDREDEKDV